MRPSLDRTVSMQQKVVEENQQGGEEQELSWTCETSKVEEMKQDVNSLFTYKNSDNILCQSHFSSFGHNQENPQAKNISLYQNHGFVQGNQQLHSIDMSSSSSSTAPMCSLDPYNQSQTFLPPKVSFSSLFNSSFMNPFDSSFDFVCGYPEPLQDMHNLKSTRVRESGCLAQISNFSPNTSFDIQANQLLPLSTDHSSRVIPFSPSDLQSFDFVNRDSQFVSRANVLKPLDKLPQVDKEATIFQRRMAHLQNSGNPNLDIKDSGGSSSIGVVGDKGKMPMEEVLQQISRKSDDESCMNSFDGSGSLGHNLIEQSRDQSDNLEGNSEYAGNSLKNKGMVIGDNHKGKRKGPPAKNLMAERRRRKKLNDRLYTLRSIVPNISKMDRASILSDAIEYVKMLVQRIDDLRKELEAIPVGHSTQPSASLDQLMKIPSIREEHCPSKLAGPVNQRIKVEVGANEGRSVNIHMYSPIRPGLLLYTMRALENIGLDVQQAVISCLNGFALDVFHAEQSKEGPDIPPEQIRAILLDAAAAAHNLAPFNQV